MQRTSRTILFFGTEDFSAYTLEMLIQKGFTIGAIITKPDSRRGRRKDLVKPRVKEIGELHRIPVWQPTHLRDIAGSIMQFDSPIGVLVSYGKLIPQSIIDLFSPGIINVHPSLLPLYRGPSPIESAILNGDTQTGVSIMQLSSAMDAGPVYRQSILQLVGTETAPELYRRLGKQGADLLTATLADIVNHTAGTIDQDDSLATYCQLIKKEDGVIDWHKTAVQIEREVRAYQGWPQSRTIIGTTEVIITHTSVADPKDLRPGEVYIESNKLYVGTELGSLAIHALKPLGKKEMPIRAFLAGYQQKLAS